MFVSFEIVFHFPRHASQPSLTANNTVFYFSTRIWYLSSFSFNIHTKSVQVCFARFIQLDSTHISLFAPKVPDGTDES